MLSPVAMVPERRVAKTKMSRVLSAVAPASLLSRSHPPPPPPTANTSLVAAGTLGMTVAHMHAHVCKLITDEDVLCWEECTGAFNGC